jgi:Protein of unknown function (DUF4242)
MPRYLIERQFDVGESEMPAVGRKSREIRNEHFPDIGWEHSHVVVGDDGRVKTYCVYDAPSEDMVLRHADQLGMHSVVGINEIAGDVTPDDFPLD